jgi:hypothetical protein
MSLMENGNVVVSANKLREMGALISKSLSWERTVMNTLWHLRNNKAIKHFLQNPELLVTYDGGLLFIKTENGVIQNPAVLYLKDGKSEGDKEPILLQGYINEYPYRHEITIFPDGNTQSPDSFKFVEKDGEDMIYAMAKDYVNGKTSALSKFPVLEIKALKTYDRYEIEAFSVIRNTLVNYKNNGSKMPLTISVFGSPGSGKSFGIKQILKQVFGKDNFVQETFNVSQFSKPEDLAAAFYWVKEINDKNENKLPLLFLDEFDSAGLDGTALGWLKNYLAPMQDGEFFDGEKNLALGRCVLVFAGATSSTFEQFRNPDDILFFKNQKGPDFVSRVQCFIDIAGPNPRTASEKSHVLRRAVLLHSFLQRYNITEIDPDIVRALLLIPGYTFGARSMETIIKMSNPKNGVLNPSDLPIGSQLAAHLPVRTFTNLLLLETLENSTDGEIAKTIHKRYISGNTHIGKPQYKPWEELSVHFKLSNISQALDYRNKLELIGCKTDKYDESKNPLQSFTPEETLIMAKQEHERWVKEKIEDGWQYAPVRNNEHKYHPNLVPWEKLTPEEQEWDKEPCNNIIPILRELGYGVYRK